MQCTLTRNSTKLDSRVNLAGAIVSKLESQQQMLRDVRRSLTRWPATQRANNSTFSSIVTGNTTWCVFGHTRL